MPLSDHEQRLLEQMERALYAEDPKFADSLRKTRRASVDRKRIVLGVAGAVAGLAVLLVGVMRGIDPVGLLLGLIGFLVMLGGAVVAYTAFVAKPETTTAAAPESQGAARPVKAPTVKTSRSRSKSSGGFMDRLEERWRKRREDRGQP